MKKIVQKVVVAGVVIKDGKVLILQRDVNEATHPNLWELPGGKREEPESSEEALVREVREESGLDVAIQMLIAVFDYQVEKVDEIRDCTQINFLASAVGEGEVALSSEHQAFVWITQEQIDDYDMSEETKGVIKKAF